MKTAASLLSAIALAGAALASPLEERFGSTLKAAAFPRYFGAALGQPHLQNKSDPLFAILAAQQFSGATPENEMKWVSTEPEQGEFNFTGGDVIRNFALEHGFVLRGHNLAWDSQLPDWIYDLSPEDTEAALVNHINVVMGHYKGQIYAWDVVNEPINDTTKTTLNTDSPFYKAMGANYVPIALRAARKADPHAKLYINDYNIEGLGAKADTMLALLTPLHKEGILDGVGFESHFIVGELPPDIQQNIQRFNDVGIEVAITELDIRTTVPETAAAAAQQPKDFTTVVDACKGASHCVGITTWGITDRYSWIPATFTGQSYGLLWDDNYKEKPAYHAVIEALNAF